MVGQICFRLDLQVESDFGPPAHQELTGFFPLPQTRFTHDRKSARSRPKVVTRRRPRPRRRRRKSCWPQCPSNRPARTNIRRCRWRPCDGSRNRKRWWPLLITVWSERARKEKNIVPTSHSNQQNLGNVLEEDASWQKPFVLPLFFLFFSTLLCGK